MDTLNTIIQLIAATAAGIAFIKKDYQVAIYFLLALIAVQIESISNLLNNTL